MTLKYKRIKSPKVHHPIKQSKDGSDVREHLSNQTVSYLFIIISFPYDILDTCCTTRIANSYLARNYSKLYRRCNSPQYRKTTQTNSFTSLLFSIH